MECIKIKNLYLFTNRYHLKSAEQEKIHTTHMQQRTCARIYLKTTSQEKNIKPSRKMDKTLE